jgi:Sulfotransferase family
VSAILDYATAGVRVAERSLVQRPRLGREERLVFVVGCPRSGTTFVGRAIGGLPGFVDFGEVTPWKAALPNDPSAAELRTILERIRRIGLAWGLRGVEQTPETAHVLRAALQAYPQARAVHVLRDGRDVVCSLLERGWLNADQVGQDDARLPYGSQPRFWVELERREEFSQVSDARRCAWAWRRYVEAARAAVASDRMLEIRYESLAAVADQLAEFLGANVTSTHRAMDRFRDSSIGRWRRELTPEQVADVETEAGRLLAELGYS